MLKKNVECIGFTVTELSVALVLIGLIATGTLGYQQLVMDTTLQANILKIENNAEQGNTDAQIMLAGSYYKGEGLPQDYDQALKWYVKAAENGNAAAQYSVGVFYEYGMGVTKDPLLAYVWFDVATTYAYRPASQKRESIKKFLTAEQLGEAQKLSQQWKKQHPMTLDQIALVQKQLKWNKSHISVLSAARN